ncbi:hypothetical protein CSE16_19030 [Solibacillus sp. R5-41]|nr:hypothetical protein CSE16_19030 [Solibacillus sp. R5-41]
MVGAKIINKTLKNVDLTALLRVLLFVKVKLLAKFTCVFKGLWNYKPEELDTRAQFVVFM